MATVNNDTKKIATAVDAGLTGHQKACFERLDFIFVRKRPGLAWSIFGVSMLTLAGVLNAYWIFEGDQNSRQAIVETKIEQVEKAQDKYDAKIDVLIDGQTKMIESQKVLIEELRKGKR